MPQYSVIIPVYNRPDEVEELLESLVEQTFSDFEVIVVEDGSQRDCKHVVEKYATRLDLKYLQKDNTGPGPSRNYGANYASGEWLIILDSDVVLPKNYMYAVDKELKAHTIDAFGGPDRAHDGFTIMQKAISYAMTSFFTTGGIRGGNKRLDTFLPRSFNMGINNYVFKKMDGFASLRFGEDIDLSLRIIESGYKTRLLPQAWVWHKRRTDLKKFFRQVFNSGIARINLYKRHPSSLKIVHILPSIFTIGVTVLILISAFGRAMMHYNGATIWTWIFAIPCILIVTWALLIAIDATLKERNIKVGTLAVIASATQLIGYGCGFMIAWWRRCVKGLGEFYAYNDTFYK